MPGKIFTPTGHSPAPLKSEGQKSDPYKVWRPLGYTIKTLNTEFATEETHSELRGTLFEQICLSIGQLSIYMKLLVDCSLWHYQ